MAVEVVAVLVPQVVCHHALAVQLGHVGALHPVVVLAVPEHDNLPSALEHARHKLAIERTHGALVALAATPRRVAHRVEVEHQRVHVLLGGRQQLMRRHIKQTEQLAPNELGVVIGGGVVQAQRRLLAMLHHHAQRTPIVGDQPQRTRLVLGNQIGQARRPRKLRQKRGNAGVLGVVDVVQPIENGSANRHHQHAAHTRRVDLVLSRHDALLLRRQSSSSRSSIR
mmetsp:Transcript_29806/g.48518  ORF Transcript_29806/g.48518 Transcript_29806/m.48518 type:complete len:225 (-) Transcript_29806:196-870(-)